MEIAILIAILTLFVAIIAAYPVLKVYVERQRIDKFYGRLGNEKEHQKDTSKFTKFIFNHDGKIIYLDINFADYEEYEIDDEGVFSFSFYENMKEPHLGGYYYRIQVGKDDDFFFDERWSSRRLKGYFKIIGCVGPQQGWFTAVMKPVNINSI